MCFCVLFLVISLFVPNLTSFRDPCRKFRMVDLLFPGGRGLFAPVCVCVCVGVLSLLMAGGFKTTRLMSELGSG